MMYSMCLSSSRLFSPYRTQYYLNCPTASRVVDRLILLCKRRPREWYWWMESLKFNGSPVGQQTRRFLHGSPGTICCVISRHSSLRTRLLLSRGELIGTQRPRGAMQTCMREEHREDEKEGGKNQPRRSDQEERHRDLLNSKISYLTRIRPYCIFICFPFFRRLH